MHFDFTGLNDMQTPPSKDIHILILFTKTNEVPQEPLEPPQTKCAVFQSKLENKSK